MHQVHVLTVVLLIPFLVCATAADWSEEISELELNTHWEKFKTSFNKNYDSTETEEMRRQIWASNMRYIEQHNLRFQRGKTSFSLAMNAFGDLLESEFQNYTCSTPPTNFHRTGGSRFKSRMNASDIPSRVDWRELGYVTPVKDQGKCRSCWAIAAIGSVEGQYFRYTGKLLNFSHQQLVDCGGIYSSNYGCRGGTHIMGLYYLTHYGLESEEDYPQTGTNSSCKFNQDKAIVNVLDYKYVDIPHLQEAIATIGPIAVGIDGRHLSFRFYHSGVYDEPNCSDYYRDLNHGGLAVGYDTTGDSPYWIVKNSWGSEWGEQGYINIARRNECGIQTNAVYPIV